MNVEDAIKERRSVRRFLSIPVEFDKVASVIEAASLAPSAGNLQNWSFIIVTDKDKRVKLAEAALQQDWMAQAQVFVVVCGDPTKAERFYGPRGSNLYTVQNCAAATENLLLAATAEGLGACWVSAFDEAEVSRILSIPEGIIPYVIVPIGYADEKPPSSERYDLEIMVFFEEYGNKILDKDKALKNFGAKHTKMLHKASEKAKDFYDEIKDRVSKKE